MKNKLFLLSAMAGILLASCGITKDGDFNARKYTKFHKGNTQVVINSVKTETQPSINKNVLTEKQTIAVNETQPVSKEIKTEINRKEKEPVKENLFASNNFKSSAKGNNEQVQKHDIKIKGFSKYVLRRLVDKPNTTSVSGGGVNIIVLVILSIILPPLAVYLARGIGNEFWLDLILTLLFWVPGVIYALLISFDVI
ncbi:MAG TPA: YqaE/Pmp3 family membrane protein [Bacteroidales bacterium]|nr:YqaE/Pmp3 family membrane protein [Bacteroidales bacterium]HPS17928.1 YqaE/Pmp3 family membrane protein [Bacteroidales bacterium]